MANYVKTIFVDGSAPGISAAFLNALQDKIIEMENACLKYKYGYISGTIEFQSLVGPDAGTVIKEVELSIYKTVNGNHYRSEKFMLLLTASEANKGKILVTLPDVLTILRVELTYYFIGNTVYIQCDNTAAGYGVGVTWYYNE